MIPARKIIPLIVACGLFMENLDSTVLSTSLPAIAASLHEDPISLKLALTSYLLSLAVFIPISGWMADRFGTRRVFFCAIAQMAVQGSIAWPLKTCEPGQSTLTETGAFSIVKLPVPLLPSWLASPAKVAEADAVPASVLFE